MTSVTFKGESVDLQGQLPELNQPAPDFSVQDVNGQSVSKADFAGKTLLISVVPDIDTSVCSIQSDKINDYAKTAAEDVAVVTISLNDNDSLTTWADEHEAMIPLYNEASKFGKDYGVYIPELDKLARSIFVIDSQGQLVYQELVSEVTNEPDYEKAFAAVEEIKD